MGAVTIRNIDDAVKLELRKRAAARGISMEQYLREMINDAVDRPVPRRLFSVEEILALGVKPKRDFDQKKVTDELYSYLEHE